MKFDLTQHFFSFANRQEPSGRQRQRQEWLDLCGILVLSLSILAVGSLAISLASYQILKATEPNVEQVASPLAWDF